MTTPSRYERYGAQTPELVQRATALAQELGFPLMPEGRPFGYEGPPSACIPEVGQLLRALAAARPGGRIGEHGTGPGIGATWLASGIYPDAHLTSVEIDPHLAQAARRLFQHHPNVEIRTGDWREALAHEPPFDLLFMDAGSRDHLTPENWDRTTELVTIGGHILFDDLTPLELWPPGWDDLIDLKRQFAFHNPRVLAAEVRTTPTQAALIVTRIK